MKKMILLFLFACLTICLQIEVFAQMQSVLNPSTERSISGFPTLTPIGNFNQSNCYNTETCDLDAVNNVQPNASYGYSNIYSHTPQPTTISFINIGNIYYTIDCQ